MMASNVVDAWWGRCSRPSPDANWCSTHESRMFNGKRTCVTWNEYLEFAEMIIKECHEQGVQNM